MRAVQAWPGPARGVRVSTVGALFLLAVGSILGAVPGWEMCFAAWAALSWLALLPTVMTLCGIAAWRFACGRGRAALRELAQAAAMLLAMAAFWPLHYLAHGVVIAGVFAELKAEAVALPNDGMPRFAWREFNESGYGHEGYAYDPSGQIVRPRESRSAAWERRVAGTLFAGKCWSASHVVGSYYEWGNNGCD